MGTSSSLATGIINNITYNSKGQRERVDYENGSTTEYVYDEHTFRLIRIHTHRPKSGGGVESLQDLQYWYDPVGNITLQRDAARQSLYYANSVVDPEKDYTYDALYRLKIGIGRELRANNGAVNYNDSSSNPGTQGTRTLNSALPFLNHASDPNDKAALRCYTQKYEYDAVGNMIRMKHIVGGTNNWTRNFTLSSTSNHTMGSSIGSKNPSSETLSYDARGNMTGGLNHLLNAGGTHANTLVYNAENRLEKVYMNGDTLTAYYQYDGQGERVRKVWKNTSGTIVHTRRYIGQWEVYTEENYSTQAVYFQRETLNVMDDNTRVAIVDTPVIDEKNTPYETPLLRYLFTDLLGTTSLELDTTALIITYEEYYPIGSTSFQSGRSLAEVSLKRYRYTGKERDEGTGMYYHGARYSVPWLARWSGTDPMAYEFPWQSPYSAMNNNPVYFIDPDGRAAVPPDDHYINNDGSIRSVQTNDNFDRFYVPDNLSETGYRLAGRLDKNDAGLVQFPASGTGFDRYGTVDAGGTSTSPAETVGQRDHYLKPETAAALFGLVNKLHSDFGFNISLGDMSSLNGSDPWQSGFKHYAGHGHLGKRSGLDVDFRYLNSDGNSFQSSNAFKCSSFSSLNNQRVYDAAATFGFPKNYQGTSGSLTGVTKVGGHNDHGHLGLQHSNLNWKYVPAAPIRQNNTGINFNLFGR